jgi:hypothetical protein
MQWRAIGQLCDIPFGTLYTLFARWTRVAPAAQPLDPGLAAGLRRHFGTQRRHHRQPLLSFRAELLRARLRRRQGDLSYRGQRLSKAGEALGITIQPSAGGHGGTFIPEGIRWVVERSLAWISRYRRLNTIFERTEGHLVAFIEIAFISILSRRLVRLGTQQISA